MTGPCGSAAPAAAAVAGPGASARCWCSRSPAPRPWARTASAPASRTTECALLSCDDLEGIMRQERLDEQARRDFLRTEEKTLANRSQEYMEVVEPAAKVAAPLAVATPATAASVSDDATLQAAIAARAADIGNASTGSNGTVEADIADLTNATLKRLATNETPMVKSAAFGRAPGAMGCAVACILASVLPRLL
eukprot:SRR837773.13318.p3 GENE.SRR837773.13318~~SRR837773.13318.p3  ORF type:complete len:194 (-),score=18.89 SRR837773.13318:87-668(-)